ncbi:MAG TPA: hypothetical protein VMJ66_17240 [Geobacteraceae bacterium]|nr:hypothetical protein [Geobacteraceae bacterium]
MRYIDPELLVKLKTLPPDKREKIIDGLIKMLAERPKGYLKENQQTTMSGSKVIEFMENSGG